MGLNKISLDQKIDGRKSRQNSFYKRKFGILRKLIQMSKLCEKDILLYIYDEDMRYLYEYQSNEKFDL